MGDGEENAPASSSNSSSNGGLKEPLLSDTASAHKSPAADHPFASGFGYNSGYRPCRDVAFAVLFVVLVLATFGFGIFSVVHRNSDFRWTESPHYVRNQSRCTLQEDHLLSSEGRFILSGQDIARGKLWLGTRVAVNADAFLVALISCIVATLILSVPIVLSLIWLLRNYTKQLVYASLPLLVLFPVGINIFWFVACTRDLDCQEAMSLSVRIVFFVFIFLLCAILVWIIFSNFARIELTIQILRTASYALYHNLSLLVVVPGLSILLLVLLVPTVVFILYSYANGKYSPHPDLKDRPELPCGRGTSRQCCVWETEGWVPAYMVLGILTLLWTVCVIAQAKVYTISGTISQWYFAQVDVPTLGAMKKSLGQAFSTSFGTVCFAGLVFAFVRAIRSAVDSAKAQQGGGGVLISSIRCCYEWVLKAIEFLTKFTIDFAAITGESFCSSAAMTYDLLKRNLLSTVFVEVISTRLMAGVTFVVSVIFAAAIWGILQATDLGSSVYIVTLVSWALLVLILSIFVAVMNIVVDTVYICYAMDKDKNVVSKPEAHEVYVLLPVAEDDRPSLAHRDSLV